MSDRSEVLYTEAWIRNEELCAFLKAYTMAGVYYRVEVIACRGSWTLVRCGCPDSAGSGGVGEEE